MLYFKVSIRGLPPLLSLHSLCLTNSNIPQRSTQYMAIQFIIHHQKYSRNGENCMDTDSTPRILPEYGGFSRLFPRFCACLPLFALPFPSLFFPFNLYCPIHPDLIDYHILTHRERGVLHTQEIGLDACACILISLCCCVFSFSVICVFPVLII